MAEARGAGRGPARLPVHHRLMAVAGVLAVVSVGLPWISRPLPLNGPLVAVVGTRVELTGTAHPVRVIVVMAAALLWWSVRRGSRRGALTACLVATAALPLGLAEGLTSGRICYALAIALAVVAVWRSPVTAPS